MLQRSRAQSAKYAVLSTVVSKADQATVQSSSIEETHPYRKYVDVADRLCRSVMRPLLD